MSLLSASSLALATALTSAAGSLAACGGSSASVAPPTDGGVAVDGASSDDDGSVGHDGGNADAAVGCVRPPAAPDRARKLVVSHPFAASGDKAKDFEVLDLTADGTLTRATPPVTFVMGTALDAPIVFTPDGEVGLVAQDDGTIGVFRLPATGGAPVVVHAAFDGKFYAGQIILAPDGSHAWVLDADTASNNGGVYAITIACDGTLTSQGLVVPGGGATAMTLLPNNPHQALLSALKAFDSAAGTDLHLVDLAASKTLASVSAFGDGGAIVSSIGVTADGKHALVGDDGLTVGNRMAVVRIDTALTALGVLQTPFPSSIVTSTYGNSALVLNGDSSDAIHVLSYDATSATTPFVITGEVAYKFNKPQIPTTASTIDRGALRGTVLVGENQGVRKLVFGADGKVTDAALLLYPDTIAGIVGVVGVQP